MLVVCCGVGIPPQKENSSRKRGEWWKNRFLWITHRLPDQALSRQHCDGCSLKFLQRRIVHVIDVTEFSYTAPCDGCSLKFWRYRQSLTLSCPPLTKKFCDHVR
jgi:hypothetical protein